MPVFIAHRGNFAGVNRQRENTLTYINEALASGYDAEVDLRVEADGNLWLGHDEAHERVTLEWLVFRQDRLWVHCKNLRALEFALDHGIRHAFFHDRDDFTLTTCGKIWTYPGRSVTPLSIIVVFPGDPFPADPVWGVCADNFSDQ